jgi:hypothetical protein
VSAAKRYARGRHESVRFTFIDPYGRFHSLSPGASSPMASPFKPLLLATYLSRPGVRDHSLQGLGAQPDQPARPGPLLPALGSLDPEPHEDYARYLLPTSSRRSAGAWPTPGPSAGTSSSRAAGASAPGGSTTRARKAIVHGTANAERGG